MQPLPRLLLLLWLLLLLVVVLLLLDVCVWMWLVAALMFSALPCSYPIDPVTCAGGATEACRTLALH